MSDQLKPETISKNVNPDKRKAGRSTIPTAVDSVNKLFYGFLIVIGVVFGTYYLMNL